MYDHLRTVIVKKTRKEHECNASIWLSEQLCEIRSGWVHLTFTEWRAVIRMMRNHWKIPKGSTCEYFVGIYDGDFFATYNDPEIHRICVKYELYDD